MFIDDLKILFPKEEFVDLIQKNIATGENAVKYRNIYMGSADTTLGAFKISEVEDFELNRTYYISETTGMRELIYSINTTISMYVLQKYTRIN